MVLGSVLSAPVLAGLLATFALGLLSGLQKFLVAFTADSRALRASSAEVSIKQR